MLPKGACQPVIVYIYIHIHIHVYIVYIHMYIYIYIYRLIYTYTHVKRKASLKLPNKGQRLLQTCDVSTLEGAEALRRLLFPSIASNGSRSGCVNVRQGSGPKQTSEALRHRTGCLFCKIAAQILGLHIARSGLLCLLLAPKQVLLDLEP